MKVLLCLALLGAVLSEVCHAQTCSTEQVATLTQSLESCNQTCLAKVCTCCPAAVEVGSSDSNYACCSTYAQFLTCESASGSASKSNEDRLLNQNINLFTFNFCKGTGGGNGGATAGLSFAASGLMLVIACTVTHLVVL